MVCICGVGVLCVWYVGCLWDNVRETFMFVWNVCVFLQTWQVVSNVRALSLSHLPEPTPSCAQEFLQRSMGGNKKGGGSVPLWVQSLDSPQHM